MSGYRLPPSTTSGVDRLRPLRFTFNGAPVDGFAGDTVASALLAQGIRHVGRSYKLHRPRGIFSCGLEEPTGLLDIGDGARLTPNTRATDIAAADGLVARTGNAWPSLKFDLAALNGKVSALLPAGFYYKTFMWPHWHLFEPTIRRMAGLGAAADAPDPDRYDEVSRQVDLLVIGAGAAGLQAAIEGAQDGRRVLLLESTASTGGWLATQPAHATLLGSMRRQLLKNGVELVTRCTGLGLYDHGMASAVQTLGDMGARDAGGPRERLWKIRARRIVVATGAFERPMLFPDNDRPGVMLANAVERYAALYDVACGRRVVIAAACDSAYATAHTLLKAGVNVTAIVDQRLDSGVAAPPGVEVHRDSSLVAVAGTRGVEGVTIAGNGGGRRLRLEADCVASAGGWTPAVNLYSMAGGKLRWVEGASMFVPDRAVPGVDVVGAAAGVFELDRALTHAGAVGRGEDAAIAPACGVGFVPARNLTGDAALGTLGRRPGKTFVDLQNDVGAADVALAARENYRSVEHLKRYTTMGMATDQGKTSNINALVLMGAHTGRKPQEVGTTKFRPPFKPVTLNALAAGRAGLRLKPLKHLPGEAWHAAQGAAFEEYGNWHRPAAYPRPGESIEAAAQREARHTRHHVGLFEGSPLGKLEISGPDAAAFLDLMYVGTMSTLKPGQARYGLLTHETGVIHDDGIVTRLGEHHFFVNTTSGGAERVALAFEEWLQCEFVDLRVLVTPVTSAWGNVTVGGPLAWRLLEAAGFDEALAPSRMPHMTMVRTRLGGIEMRVLRASFSGELGYEINLPALHTQALLEHLGTVGRAFDAAPYGIEALMVMRTEKGFIHVGGDTDGTTLPGDIGMDRGVAKKAANFVGRRSLQQPAAKDPDRMQLVGLLPLDRRTLPPVGAHVAPHAPPAPIEGFVTSSCHSPALGHPVALAMLRRGPQRLGEQVTVYHLGRPIAAEVVRPSFFDPQGERLNGHA
ncbi:2Fe-2S iron-sulfur cluster-binding protein [Mitsuaria sp. GD03876]|uniref:2Fe-2S iron-sulfur cluster-binding protein n=1 Tax=Mitsuaria sp. GD03876 TaxID=2975399 RepID=UPI00244C507E|nr:2Fe-2S iron-sulfur cluster-binding protein [Mitsuaria sp. GD03876]MDH0866263.1 2Fe-2S iron-sulfur cluster-binding protein [Mitsuaria sp. GD03876]